MIESDLLKVINRSMMEWVEEEVAENPESDVTLEERFQEITLFLADEVLRSRPRSPERDVYISLRNKPTEWDGMDPMMEAERYLSEGLDDLNCSRLSANEEYAYWLIQDLYESNISPT